jgi:hypothetical protein
VLFMCLTWKCKLAITNLPSSMPDQLFIVYRVPPGDNILKQWELGVCGGNSLARDRYLGNLERWC